MPAFRNKAQPWETTTRRQFSKSVAAAVGLYAASIVPATVLLIASCCPLATSSCWTAPPVVREADSQHGCRLLDGDGTLWLDNASFGVQLADGATVRSNDPRYRMTTYKNGLEKGVEENIPDVQKYFANGVELEYVGRKDYKDGVSYMTFEGTEGWGRGWRAPNRVEAEPRSILDAEVKFEDFPYLLRNEKTEFIECVRSRGRTLEDAEVGHRSSTVVQLGYIACLLGRKLNWDPEKEPRVRNFIPHSSSSKRSCKRFSMEI